MRSVVVVLIILSLNGVSCSKTPPPPPLSRTYPPVDVAVYRRVDVMLTPTPLPTISAALPPDKPSTPPPAPDLPVQRQTGKPATRTSTIPEECQTTQRTRIYRLLTAWKMYYQLQDVHAPDEQVEHVYQDIRTLQECFNHAPISPPE